MPQYCKSSSVPSPLALCDRLLLLHSVCSRAAGSLSMVCGTGRRGVCSLPLEPSSLDTTGTRRLRCPIHAGALRRVSCPFSYLSSSDTASITETKAVRSSTQLRLAERRACLADALLRRGAAAEPSPASSGESWPGTAGMNVLPEQGQPPLRSLLQPASPIYSQAWEHWSFGGIFCPKSGPLGQGWSGRERQRCPYANREELLLQSSFSLMP